MKPMMLGANQLCVHMFLWKRWMWQMYQIKSCMRYVKLFTPWLNQLVSKLLVAKWLCIKKTSNNRQSACNKGFTLCSAADDVCITTVSLSWLCLVVVASFQLFAFYAVSTPRVQIILLTVSHTRVFKLHSIVHLEFECIFKRRFAATL